MPDLLEGPSPLRVEYTVSLPHSLLATIALMCAAPHFEGLGDWLREARAQLPPELRDDLCLLITFPGSYQRFTGELIAYLPPEAPRFTFGELLAHLQRIPAVHYQAIALRALARAATPPPPITELADLLNRPAEWAEYLAGIGSEVEPQTVAGLVRDGQALRDRLLQALERFWTAVYEPEFAATRPLMERSTAHHQAQPYGPLFHDLFTSVTGRLVPEGIQALLPGIRSVTFVPSCYVGPYVAYTHHADQITLYYNCRTTPTGPIAVDGAVLYPPIKALADETRLQILALLRGKELYAQEIVEQLEISQPAVSRHLNLMAAAGVLKTRREGNAKYYAVDAETLALLADALRTYL